jgi:predicted GNAT family acetyltransferase
MNAREYANPIDFLERVKEFLFKNELENNLLLSSLLAIAKLPAGGVRFFLVEDAQVVVAAALLTSKGRLILNTASPDAAKTMASHLVREKIRTLFTSLDAADTFVSEAPGLKRHGSQVLMGCSKLSAPKSADGVFRTAQSRDLRILLQWTNAFTKECRLDDSPQESEETVRKFVEHKQAFIWESPKGPVAMAAYGGITPAAARMSLVYAEPSMRKKGYGTMVVSRLAHKILESKKSVLLFADTANPASIGLYKKLGFESIQEFSEFRS